MFVALESCEAGSDGLAHATDNVMSRPATKGRIRRGVVNRRAKLVEACISVVFR